jgi:hypothetical protein
MFKSSIALAAWIALNAMLPVTLMARRPRPRQQHLLFRWVIGDHKSDRPRRLARDLILSHRHHH